MTVNLTVQKWFKLNVFWGKLEIFTLLALPPNIFPEMFVILFYINCGAFPDYLCDLESSCKTCNKSQYTLHINFH